MLSVLKHHFSLRRNLFLFLLLTLINFLLYYFSPKTLRDYVVNYEKGLHSIEMEAAAELQDLYSNYQKSKSSFSPENFKDKYAELFREKGIVYLIYANDSLVFWSDNSPSVENYRKEICLDNSIVKLRNGWYEVVEHPQSNKNKEHFIALILLKREFAYQNKYLKSGFPDYFKTPDFLEVNANSLGQYSVKNYKGVKLFEFENASTTELKHGNNNMMMILFLIQYMLLIVLLYAVCFQVLPERLGNLRLLTFSLAGMVVLMLLKYFGIPENLINSSLYNPEIYGSAGSIVFPRLGTLILNIILCFVFSIAFKRHFRFSEKNFFVEVFISVVLIFFSIQFFNSVIRALVQDSQISFRLNDFFSISELSLLSVVSVSFIFVSIYNFVSACFIGLRKKRKFRLIIILVLVSISNIFYYLFFTNSGLLIALWPALFFILYYFNFLNLKNDTFSALFPIVIFSSLITAHLFKVELDNKEIEFRKVYVQSLSGQQDDVAENLFVDVSKKIQSDNELGKLIFSLPVNSLDIEQRLRQIHLGGYWEKFEVIVSITDSLCNPLIKTENPVHGNNSFFDEQIESCGVPTVSSSFYFIDHPGSRQRYIARIPLVNPASTTKKPYTVYLQFESKNRVEETGFPDLLLDQSVNANKNLSDYSFAVYKDGNLLSRSGDYNYPEVFFIKNNSLEEYSECLKNDFHHIASTNKNISTVVSVPLESTLSGLSHYSSFFVFFSFLLIIYFFLRNIINRKGIFPSSFGSRIQFLLVFVVFTALIFFGLATFYVVKDQFENQNKSSIQQQSQVILNEIQKQFENADDLKTSYKDYSNYMVKKISGIFKNDISLFDLRGNLFASSQPRLFDEGIISKKMNPKAYAELIKSEFISFAIKERTGDLEYFSSYHQLKNNNGKILGFVNLPFFAKQGDFEKEVMLYTSALTNIYVLLFVLSVLTALFFSNMLTKPLRLLKQKFRKMSLNRKNEILIWEENDEIGSLVAEYNRMITELEISADKLAASERETAWREMAKQVAHEIKNPLTPMKLNIQHLQRTLNNLEKDELISKVTKTSEILIEQIDTLSSIASAFSSFAKMPEPNIEKINIINLLQDTVHLFRDTENTEISFASGGIKELNVLADREHFKRAVLNLIKNAIQAIPENTQGQVAVSVSKNYGKVLIQVKDDGVGISEENKMKIFQPNFSTKTEGMGLGLALVKSAVESFGGKIYFETKIGEGSTFTIELEEAKN